MDTNTNDRPMVATLGKAATDRYQAVVLATRRLLMSEGINPDDASQAVWADACRRAGVQSVAGDYLAYVAECEAEECEPHSLHMWKVHGSPAGPI